MGSVKPACCWLAAWHPQGRVPGWEFNRHLCGGSFDISRDCLFGSLWAMRILYHRECPLITEASLVKPWVLPPSVQPSQGPATRTRWFCLAALVELHLFHLLLHAALSSCSGLDSKETELYPERYTLPLNQSFYIVSRRKN